MRTMSMMVIVVMFTLFGCTTTEKTSHLKLTKSEIKELCSRDNVTVSDSLRQRLIEGSDELKLTPEEMIVLKSTGKVILCGECGYILDSLQFKKHQKEEAQEDANSQGFIKGSLRERIVGPYTD